MVTDADREQALAAIARILVRRKGVTLSGLRIKDLIEEGRSGPSRVKRVDDHEDWRG